MALIARCHDCAKNYRVPHDRKEWRCKAFQGFLDVLQTQAPDHLRGRVMGFFAFMALGMSPLGALQIGWLSEHLGVAWAMTLGGIVTVAAVVWLGRSHLSPPPPTR